MESAERAVSHEVEDVDLSATLTKLNRIKAKNRARLANSELTRAFLDSALLLSGLLLDERADSAEEGDPPTFDYLSRPRIVSRTQSDFPQLAPTVAKFRDRWISHHDFLGDFIAYSMLILQRSVQQALVAWSEDLLRADADFATAVHRAAFEGAQLVLSLPAYRLQLLTIASAAADHDVSTVLRGMYAALTKSWLELYAHVAETFGLRLRPGISAEAFNTILQAVLEGLCVRRLAGVDESFIDVPKGESILGTAALALFVALVDDGDGLTIEQEANGRFARRGMENIEQ